MVMHEFVNLPKLNSELSRLLLIGVETKQLHVKYIVKIKSFIFRISVKEVIF